MGGNEFASTIAADARNSADILDKMPAHDSPIISLPTIPSVAEDEPIAVSEYLAEDYLRFADASTNPDIPAMSQRLANVAVYRLATLRSVAGKVWLVAVFCNAARCSRVQGAIEREL